MRLFSLILSAVCLLGCAATAAQSPALPEPDTRVSIQAETQTAKDDTESGITTASLLPSADGKDAEESKIISVEETPKSPEDAETPSGKAEETPPASAGEEQPDVPEQPDALEQPTAPEQTMTPAPQPEPALTEPEEPTPASVQEPEPTPTPEPEPEPEPEYEPADRWAAVETANAYAAAQYGVTTDSGLTLNNSAYRFPASVSADASQETLEVKARDMVDYTFLQLMMQAGVDTLTGAGLRCNVCIVEDGASLLIYVLYAG